MINPGIFNTVCKETQFANGFNISSVPCLTIFSISFGFHNLDNFLFWMQITSNSHSGKNVSNIGEDFFFISTA